MNGGVVSVGSATPHPAEPGAVLFASLGQPSTSSFTPSLSESDGVSSEGWPEGAANLVSDVWGRLLDTDACAAEVPRSSSGPTLKRCRRHVT